MTERILLDTDIGSDIDDAVCLAYLLSQPECELLGITTVSGEPVKRGMISSAICKAAKKAVPIYPGIEFPLLISQMQACAQQAKVLGNWQHESEFPQGEAIEFLRRTIRKYPGEVTLLAIGPLTNIAVLFAADPEIPGLLKRLALMGGVFTNNLPNMPHAEWNILCDPHAAAMVYKAKVKIHRSIGLDVTCQVTMDKHEVIEKFKSEIMQPVVDFAKVWFDERPVITFHDPLAAATIFNDRICRFERGNVEVEMGSERVKGMTHWTPGNSTGQHEVALKVDKDRFFDHFFKTVNS